MSEDSDQQPGWQFWIDRGGTFTDVIACAPDGAEYVRKLRSDAPSLYADAAVAAIAEVLARHGETGATIESVRIGTTVATNALLERQAPPVALVVNEGFSDLLDIADQRRRELFGLALTKRRVPIDHCLTTTARMTASGEELAAVDEDGLLQQFRELVAAGVQHVAISLLHNWRFPNHEQQIKSLALQAGLTHVTCSHESAPTQGYLARTETTLVDAWLTPVLSSYLERFRNELDRVATVGEIFFMQSHGGLAAADKVRGKDAVLSGPAGGLIALARGAASMRFDSVIGIDMGGTSTDLCHWRGHFEQQSDNEIGGYRLHTPMLRLETIASGGGSLLGCTDGRLTVGPESAGALPGPAAYGLNGPATLTDANVVLGRLPVEHVPAVFGSDGRSQLSRAESVRSLKALSDANPGTLSAFSTEALAEKWLAVSVEQIAASVRQLALRHGSDLRRFTLAAFGGAAGQLACRVAEAVGIRRVWLHPRAGVLSALGIGLADQRSVQERSIGQPLDRCWPELTQQRELHAQSIRKDQCQEVTLLLHVDGADGVLESPWDQRETVVETFNALHRERFGVAPEGQVIVAAIRMTAVIRRSDYLPLQARQGEADPVYARVWIDGRKRESAISPVESLGRTPLSGPALLIDQHTTIIVEPNWHATRDEYGNVVLEHTPAQENRVSATDFGVTDPAMLEIFNRRFTLVAEHMGHVLGQTAHSVNIRERLDYSCALFDADANLIANAPHMPVHLGSMGASVRHVLDHSAELHPDDVYIINSPYAGGTHLPDITAVRPWFDETGQLRFFLASRAHHADVGGITPGSMPAHSKNITEEGILFDNFQLVARGHFRERELRLALSEGPYPARNPDRNISDLRAQLASLQEGSQQLDAMISEFGRPLVTHYMQAVFDNARNTIASVIRELQPGAASVPLDQGAKFDVQLTPRDGRLIVHFDCSAQSAGNFNAPSSVTRAAVLYFLRVLAARDIPLNDGCLADVDLVIPQDSLLAPAAPAAVVAGNVETSQAITNALFAAAGTMAHAQGTMNNLTFGNDSTQYYETIAGGSGAGDGFDGIAAVQTHMTNSRMTDTEILESRLPVQVCCFERRPNSGGSGRWRGGDGVVRQLRVTQAVEVSILSNNRSQGPAGLAGGSAGSPGRNVVIRRDGSREPLAAVDQTSLDAGDIIEICTPGGGGFGTPVD